MPETLLFIVPILGLAVILVFVVTAIMLVSRLMGRGVRHLAESYGTAQQPAGPTFRFQTVKIGAILWKRCTTVVVSPEGLFLGVRPPLGTSAQLLIPWDRFTSARHARLMWRSVYELAVGDPPETHVTVPADVIEAMRPYVGELLSGARN